MDYSRIDPLVSISGEKIETVSDWETFRRDEIMVLLSNFIYGVRPTEKPDNVSYTVCKTENNFMGFSLVKKSVSISFLDFSMSFSIFIPQNKYKKEPVPAFLHILNETSMLKFDPENNPENTFLPITAMAERGYGCIIMPTLTVSPDWVHSPNFKKGIFAAIQPDTTARNNRSWANISGWAYGASLIMDYLETDTDIEHTKIGVSGHSRAGKAALWAGATDKRFACVISNDSGCSGASYTRGKKGIEREHIKDINISDWFCGNYHKFDDREEMLPCDQHMLLAAIAPRPLYVKSNAEDLWAGPDEELKSCILASPVYELYGLKGIIADEKIVIDKPYHDGNIAYRRAPGDHDLNLRDWSMFMDFADNYLRKR